jgi:hypothetical protein
MGSSGRRRPVAPPLHPGPPRPLAPQTPRHTAPRAKVACDDFYSGQAAALAGGTTMHIDFALPINHNLLEGFKAWQVGWVGGIAQGLETRRDTAGGGGAAPRRAAPALGPEA